MLRKLHDLHIIKRPPTGTESVGGVVQNHPAPRNASSSYPIVFYLQTQLLCCIFTRMETLFDFDTLELEPEEPSNATLAVLSGPVSWSPRIAFEVAMGESDTDILVRHNLTAEEYQRIVSHPAFRKEVSTYIQDIRDNGVSFKAKARIQAEEYLEVVDTIVNNPELGASTRMDAIKSVVKWAGLETQPVAQGAGAQPQFNIQINL